MIKIKKSKKINAPLERVFEYFSDPTNLPDIWPSMIEVKNVVSHNGQRSFDYVYKMAGIRLEGHSEMLEFEPNERVMTQSKKGIPSVFVCSYSEVDNMTKVSIQVEYEIPDRVLAKTVEPIIRKLNERELGTLLTNLKDRMELSREMPMGARKHGSDSRAAE